MVEYFDIDIDVVLHFWRQGIVTVHARALTEMAKVIVRELNRANKGRTSDEIIETCRSIANGMGTAFVTKSWLSADRSTHTATNMERLREELRDDRDADRKNFFIDNASVEELQTMCGNVGVRKKVTTEDIDDD